MDWFQCWPNDALVAISSHFISRFELDATPQVKPRLMQAMGEFQVSTVCIKTDSYVAYNYAVGSYFVLIISEEEFSQEREKFSLLTM